MGKRKRGTDGRSNASGSKWGFHEDESQEVVPAEDVDVSIDGSLGEGGGQIIRVSIALSSILDRSVRISRIRHGRSKPGLRAQHSSGVRLVSDVCCAKVFGSIVGSSTLTFIPQKSHPEHHAAPAASTSDQGRSWTCDVGTAGATALVLQAVLPAALRFLPSCESRKQNAEGLCADTMSHTLHIRGGTTALFAPTSDYVKNVLVPNLRLFGINVKYCVEKDGFFPRGGGSCTVSIDKAECLHTQGEDGSSLCTLRPCHVTHSGNVTEICGRVLFSGPRYERERLAEEMRDGALSTLKRFIEENRNQHELLEVQVLDQKVDAHANDEHLSITLWAKATNQTTFGASSLWSEADVPKYKDLGIFEKKATDSQTRRRSAAHVGSVAAEELCASLKSGAVVDSYMADQLCIFMAMASGVSSLIVPLPTQHLISVLDVLHKFGINIRLEDVAGSPNKLMICEGIAVALR